MARSEEISSMDISVSLCCVDEGGASAEFV